MSKSSNLTLFKRLRRYVFSTLLRKFLISQRATTLLSIQHVLKMNEEVRGFAKNKFFLSRESLFKHILMKGSKFNFFEFGVASGALTKYFVSKHMKSINVWHGFDTFYGLPENWGDLPKGTFSTNGYVPEINCKQLVWHIGRIEKNLSLLEKLSTNSTFPHFYIFDLDLYEPSKATWDCIKQNLKSGDIIYFDEAYYYDEKRILNEISEKSDVQMLFLGYTIFAVAFQIL